jgi:protein-L-isoaspartate(D-aspartate) O-methyltransferase
MVAEQLKRRGIYDPRVLEAMATVPRHLFVPPDIQSAAYADAALPIGYGQTISQPYVVALMLQEARVGPQDRVLEVGTGSGYSTAVLAHLAREVYSIERHKTLFEEARERLTSLGYRNVHLRHGDGTMGWPEHAPYDAIIVTAAAPEVPEPLKEQLAEGGRLVIPIGTRDSQVLVRLIRRGDRIERRTLGEVRFVPLIGEHGFQVK